MENSDIDLFILVEKKNVLQKTILGEIKEKYEGKYKLETILMDEEEFKKKKKDALIKEIMKGGINIVPKSHK